MRGDYQQLPVYVRLISFHS